MTYLTLIRVNMSDEYGGFFNKNRMLYKPNSKNEHENGVGGMVLYKRSGRFCPRIFTLIIGFILEIRGR
ncbi:hypothetical protein AM598_19230 [Paenibacillus polymyxa]|nr:hypothetical protein AM598_19230 [Paenibacillus polymyxa]